MPGFVVKAERDQRVKERISATFAEKVTAIEQERDLLCIHVKKALRKALGESGEGSLIETVHGVGFR